MPVAALSVIAEQPAEGQLANPVAPTVQLQVRAVCATKTSARIATPTAAATAAAAAAAVAF